MGCLKSLVNSPGPRVAFSTRYSQIFHKLCCLIPRPGSRNTDFTLTMTRLNIYIKTAFLFYYYMFIIEYVQCQLPSSQLTTMNNLHQVLQITKWNSSQNPCSWQGVLCNNSSVSMLSLSSLSISNLNESYWSSLVCQIQTLESLDLSNNQLTSIPRLLISSSCAAAGLNVLNLSRNRLTGPLPTFQTSSLHVLDLSYNFLSNDVSSNSPFDALNELQSLNIRNNNFTGSVPTKLGGGSNSTLLVELQLSFNSFKGNIPDEITKYSNLTLLDLGGNQLVGNIPSRIGDLSKLQFLLLSANYLTGEIPRSVSTITTLKRFAANQNSFTGSIPFGITSYLSNLDLSYNKLNGSIPDDLLSHANLQTVDLSFNDLEGSIPSNVSTTLVRLRLGSNQLRGLLPSWSFGNDVPSLAYLEVDHNKLSGTIPPELGLYKNLSLLDLSHNNLVGILPPELVDLGRLQVFQLQHNNLSGVIPNEISRLAFLVRLNMSWNSLSGSIPPSLSSLRNLSNLDLQVNNLSGELPDSFGSMDSLLELQLGKNRLGGVVRSLPTNLQISLNLSHNNFQGSIPAVLSRLQQLEILDLSNNRFSGDIPSFMGEMASLTQILLSNNMLTGFIPQFRPNVILSVDGNKNLINRTSSPSTPVRKNEKSVSVGIVVASTGAVVALIIVVLVSLIVSRRIHKVNDEVTNSWKQPEEVVKGSLLTLNVIHRTNLDFTKAMEAVGYPSNIVIKTRFSTYYKATMPSGKCFFVKKLNSSDKIFQIGSHDLFEHEIETLGRLRNSSVMIPLAYVLTTDNAYLFYEFSEKGTLFDVLHGSLETGLDWTNRYSIALGVANGLAFLHTCPSGPIALLDLSSKNVMLKSLNDSQIGDIELSKVTDPSKSTNNLSAVAGSVGYVPPEYAYTMRVTTSGNVYSFGVILLELLTGKPAVSEGSELAKWVSGKSMQQHNADQILDATVSRTSAAIKDQMLSVLKVALACVSISPEARPEMKSVLRMLLNTRN